MAEQKKPAVSKPAAKKPARKRAPRKTAEQKRLETEVAELKAAAAERNEPVNSAPEPAPNPQKYIRNIRNTPVRFKLERHGREHRGINLQPRGWRGDIRAIQSEDVLDPIFQANEGLLFEVISADEAAFAVTRQNNNAAAQHPALAAITNEKGKKQGEMKLTVENPEDKSVVVAQLDDDGNVEVNRQGIVRQRGESPGTPGYISGAEVNHAPAGEEASFLSDQKARQKGNTDLGLNVSVAPTQGGIVNDGFAS